MIKVFEVGIDEVGRGAIFGPVFAAAVVLTEKNKYILKQFGVTDSKKLTPKKRKVFKDKKDEIELTEELNNTRKKRRRSSASIE